MSRPTAKTQQPANASSMIVELSRTNNPTQTLHSAPHSCTARRLECVATVEINDSAEGCNSSIECEDGAEDHTAIEVDGCCNNGHSGAKAKAMHRRVIRIAPYVAMASCMSVRHMKWSLESSLQLDCPHGLCLSVLTLLSVCDLVTYTHVRSAANDH